MDEREPLPIDWTAAPPRYKRYPGAARIVLNDPSAPRVGLAVPSAVRADLECAEASRSGRAWVGEMLRGLLGLTRIGWRHPHDEIGRPLDGRSSVTIGRPVPSGGALYPIEAYLATATALCHYDVVHHALEVVRDGDHRNTLGGLLAQPPAALPEVVLVLSAVFWRNGFKYGDFAYRLHCQEVGVLTAQALALSEPLGLQTTVHLDFDGHTTDHLLNLPPSTESTLAVLTVSPRPTVLTVSPRPTVLTISPRPTPKPPTGPAPGAVRVSAGPARTVGETPGTPSGPPQALASRLPHLAALHAAARRTPHARAVPPADPLPPLPAGPTVMLPEAEPVRLADGVTRRASPVNGFRPEALNTSELSRILAAAHPSHPAHPIQPVGLEQDGLGRDGVPQGGGGAGWATAPYVFVLRVTGVDSGAYRYDPGQGALLGVGDPDAVAMLSGGRFNANTRHGLRTAAAAIVPVGDPLAGVGSFGDLWYRIQQAEAGLVVHRAALAAAALGRTARIHSDGAAPATDAALRLAGTSWRALSFLLVGAPRMNGPVLGIGRTAQGVETTPDQRRPPPVTA
ncbi:SagB family peptide dehydrogenase [Nonomuraea sp. NPDC046570]|uniref:SagB family peptide dehydrogenase n=1 Tax=Nonomuraea sp. NPDC046570 TaxID=3155255 RepID=UPI003401C57C